MLAACGAFCARAPHLGAAVARGWGVTHWLHPRCRIATIIAAPRRRAAPAQCPRLCPPAHGPRVAPPRTARARCHCCVCAPAHPQSMLPGPRPPVALPPPWALPTHTQGGPHPQHLCCADAKLRCAHTPLCARACALCASPDRHHLSSLRAPGLLPAVPRARGLLLQRARPAALPPRLLWSALIAPAVPQTLAYLPDTHKGVHPVELCKWPPLPNKSGGREQVVGHGTRRLSAPQSRAAALGPTAAGCSCSTARGPARCVRAQIR